jgi:hypothetical protein
MYQIRAFLSLKHAQVPVDIEIRDRVTILRHAITSFERQTTEGFRGHR